MNEYKTLDEIWESITKDQLPLLIDSDLYGTGWLLLSPVGDKYAARRDGGYKLFKGYISIWRIHQEPKPKVKLYPALMRDNLDTMTPNYFMEYYEEKDDIRDHQYLVAWNPPGYPPIEVER